MAKYEFTGTVTEILPVRAYGQRGIQSREFRCKEQPVNTNSKWENKLPFVINYDPTGDKYNNLGQLDAIQVGDKVKFSFTMRGREWTNPKDQSTRIFVDNKVCSKIEVLERVASAPRTLIPDFPDTSVENGDATEDDMPF